MGKLGQTRAHRQRARARVIAQTRLPLDSARVYMCWRSYLAIANFQSNGLFTPMPGLLSTCV